MPCVHSAGLLIFSLCRSQKLSGIFMLRIRKQLVHRILFHQNAVLHHQDTITDLIDHVQVMADKQITQIILLFQINQQLKAVGEMIYGTHPGNPTDSDVLLNKLQEIDGLYAQIAELEELIGRRPAPAACPSCGQVSQEGDLFCRGCGTKL